MNLFNVLTDTMSSLSKKLAQDAKHVEEESSKVQPREDPKLVRINKESLGWKSTLCSSSTPTSLGMHQFNQSSTDESLYGKVAFAPRQAEDRSLETLQGTELPLLPQRSPLSRTARPYSLGTSRRARIKPRRLSIREAEDVLKQKRLAADQQRQRQIAKSRARLARLFESHQRARTSVDNSMHTDPAAAHDSSSSQERQRTILNSRSRLARLFDSYQQGLISVDNSMYPNLSATDYCMPDVPLIHVSPDSSSSTSTRWSDSVGSPDPSKLRLPKQPPSSSRVPTPQSPTIPNFPELKPTSISDIEGRADMNHHRRKYAAWRAKYDHHTTRRFSLDQSPLNITLSPPAHPPPTFLCSGNLHDPDFGKWFSLSKKYRVQKLAFWDSTDEAQIRWWQRLPFTSEEEFDKCLQHWLNAWQLDHADWWDKGHGDEHPLSSGRNRWFSSDNGFDEQQEGFFEAMQDHLGISPAVDMWEGSPKERLAFFDFAMEWVGQAIGKGPRGKMSDYFADDEECQDGGGDEDVIMTGYRSWKYLESTSESENERGKKKTKSVKVKKEPGAAKEVQKPLGRSKRVTAQKPANSGLDGTIETPNDDEEPSSSEEDDDNVFEILGDAVSRLQDLEMNEADHAKKKQVEAEELARDAVPDDEILGEDSETEDHPQEMTVQQQMLNLHPSLVLDHDRLNSKDPAVYQDYLRRVGLHAIDELKIRNAVAAGAEPPPNWKPLAGGELGDVDVEILGKIDRGLHRESKEATGGIKWLNTSQRYADELSHGPHEETSRGPYRSSSEAPVPNKFSYCSSPSQQPFDTETSQTDELGNSETSVGNNLTSQGAGNFSEQLTIDLERTTIPILMQQLAEVCQNSRRAKSGKERERFKRLKPELINGLVAKFEARFKRSPSPSRNPSSSPLVPLEEQESSVFDDLDLGPEMQGEEAMANNAMRVLLIVQEEIRRIEASLRERWGAVAMRSMTWHPELQPYYRARDLLEDFVKQKAAQDGADETTTTIFLETIRKEASNRFRQYAREHVLDIAEVFIDQENRLRRLNAMRMFLGGEIDYEFLAGRRWAKAASKQKKAPKQPLKPRKKATLKPQPATSKKKASVQPPPKPQKTASGKQLTKQNLETLPGSEKGLIEKAEEEDDTSFGWSDDEKYENAVASSPADDNNDNGDDDHGESNAGSQTSAPAPRTETPTEKSPSPQPEKQQSKKSSSRSSAYKTPPPTQPLTPDSSGADVQLKNEEAPAKTGDKRKRGGDRDVSPTPILDVEEGRPKRQRKQPTYLGDEQDALPKSKSAPRKRKRPADEDSAAALAPAPTAAPPAKKPRGRPPKATKAKKGGEQAKSEAKVEAVTETVEQPPQRAATPKRKLKLNGPKKPQAEEEEEEAAVEEQPEATPTPPKTPKFKLNPPKKPTGKGAVDKTYKSSTQDEDEDEDSEIDRDTTHGAKRKPTPEAPPRGTPPKAVDRTYKPGKDDKEQEKVDAVDDVELEPEAELEEEQKKGKEQGKKRKRDPSENRWEPVNPQEEEESTEEEEKGKKTKTRKATRTNARGGKGGKRRRK